MRDMDRREREALDRHITGNYGEDQFKGDDQQRKQMTQIITPTLSEFSAVNRSRADRWHAGATPWTGADWSNAMCGEAGEAANIVKKLRRHETSIESTYNTPEPSVLHRALADEIADVVTYADLLAHYYGISLADSVVQKFNQVSEAQGFPERLDIHLRRYDE